jgi:hypothetical protein
MTRRRRTGAPVAARAAIRGTPTGCTPPDDHPTVLLLSDSMERARCSVPSFVRSLMRRFAKETSFWGFCQARLAPQAIPAFRRKKPDNLVVGVGVVFPCSPVFRCYTATQRLREAWRPVSRLNASDFTQMVCSMRKPPCSARDFWRAATFGASALIAMRGDAEGGREV